MLEGSEIVPKHVPEDEEEPRLHAPKIVGPNTHSKWDASKEETELW